MRVQNYQHRDVAEVHLHVLLMRHAVRLSELGATTLTLLHPQERLLDSLIADECFGEGPILVSRIDQLVVVGTRKRKEQEAILIDRQIHDLALKVAVLREDQVEEELLVQAKDDFAAPIVATTAAAIAHLGLRGWTGGILLSEAWDAPQLRRVLLFVVEQLRKVLEDGQRLALHRGCKLAWLLSPRVINALILEYDLAAFLLVVCRHQNCFHFVNIED